ncbi:Trichothecene biosynthesis transcription regulator TRI10-like protein [Cladobotryum mycophilum]|uniref:Trichothecene biosynthesis transcription regulator TRI10-like protein n=1 Tax=Cladobotryum mycophilum TaxID=491253 RepID=A0ABR0SSM2_9HYPO
MAHAIRAQLRQNAEARRGQDFTVQVFPLVDSQQGPHHPQSSNDELSHDQEIGGNAALVDLATLDETDNFFITLYLDTVFPSLFPWYQPATLSGGRSWLLAVLRANKAFFHTAMSLSSYYFTLVLARDASHTIRTPCEQHVWDSLAMHMNLSIQVIRQHTDDLNIGQVKSNVIHQTHVLGGIVQLLVLETSIAGETDWNSHLTAALVLLDDIFQAHGMRDGRCNLASILDAMQRSSIFDGMSLGFPVWNADQAAFQFFTALLIYADIMSSILLRSSPRLRHCHRDLVVGHDLCSNLIGGTQPLLQMENYIGCHGWVLVIISEISELGLWKRSARPEEGGCAAEEFMRRTRELEDKLKKGSKYITEPSELMETTNHAPNGVLATRIWIYAATMYLILVKEGWKSGGHTMRDNVESVLNLFQLLPPQTYLRSLIWPFCVSGLLATTEQEQAFRKLISDLGPLRAFGATKEAVQLMERVWQRREQLDDSWGLADCFEIQGCKILLI